MKYSDAEKLIENGDLVFFRAKKWYQKIIAHFTRGKYSHVGIVFWMRANDGENTLFFVDTMPGKGRTVSIFESYKSETLEIVSCGLNWDNVSSFALNHTGTSTYSLIDAFLLGLERTFNVDLVKKPFGEVCSEFVAVVLNRDGFQLKEDVDPNALYELLFSSKNAKLKLTVN